MDIVIQAFLMIDSALPVLAWVMVSLDEVPNRRVCVLLNVTHTVENGSVRRQPRLQRHSEDNRSKRFVWVHCPRLAASDFKRRFGVFLTEVPFRREAVMATVSFAAST